MGNIIYLFIGFPGIILASEKFKSLTRIWKVMLNSAANTSAVFGPRLIALAD